MGGSSPLLVEGGGALGLQGAPELERIPVTYLEGQGHSQRESRGN